MKPYSFDSLQHVWRQRIYRTLTLACLSFTLTIALANQSLAVLLPTQVEPDLQQQPVAMPPAPLQVAQLIGISNSQYQRLAEADRFYLEGNLQMAEKISREVKPPFKGGEMAIPQPILDVESAELAPAARVYWRNGIEGIQQNLESKIFKPLQLLTQNYPDFIPGHIKLAEACEKDAKGCKRNADADQPDNAVDVLQRASSLYPESTDILDALLATLDRAANASSKDSFEYFLDASIAARQFSLTYPNHPRALQYADLANGYMQQYQSTLNSVIQGYIIGGSIIGNSEDVLTLNLLLQGESAYGQASAQSKKEELSIVNDPALQAYVNDVGWKMARQMGRDEFNYEFIIFEGGPFDAFALPGGKVFISTGTLRTCRSEAELAGILGHEVAHTALSHGFRKAAETTVMKVFSRIIPFGKDLTDLAESQFSQAQERQADLMATRSLSQTKYAADGLWSLMLTLREATRDAPVPWLSSHPAPPDRVRYLENLITRNNYNRYAYSGVTRHAQALGLVPAQTVATSSTPQSGNSFAPGGSTTVSPANSSGNQNPPTRKTGGTQRPVGDVPLTAMVERQDVTIRVDSANVSRTGTYSLSLSIENQSDRPFAFVPLFAEVLTSSGKKVKARYTFEAGESGSVVAEPGQILRGKVTILGQPWVANDKQDLTLLIKEGTSNSRVFRIPI